MNFSFPLPFSLHYIAKATKIECLFYERVKYQAKLLIRVLMRSSKQNFREFKHLLFDTLCVAFFERLQFGFPFSFVCSFSLFQCVECAHAHTKYFGVGIRFLLTSDEKRNEIRNMNIFMRRFSSVSHVYCEHTATGGRVWCSKSDELFSKCSSK